jgi:hypothetical protein
MLKTDHPRLGEGKRKMSMTCCDRGKYGRVEVVERQFQFAQMSDIEIRSGSPQTQSTFSSCRV